jgi:DNA repair exonuclease SbcCD nuclease subunit
MKRILRVGDPHVTLSNLEDSKKLIGFIIAMAHEYKVDRVEFLGDLFHTHAVKRLEVEKFWLESFEKILANKIPILCLVGNHDQIGKGSEDFSALDAFKLPNLTVVKSPISLDGITYVGYYRDTNKLVELANRLPNACLVAHATFTGAQYENGFYAEDGVDPGLFHHDTILSGHIHKAQQVGKCTYIGTPKWDTISDANQDKGVWIFDHADTGEILSEHFISTKNVVTPITHYVVNEGDELPDLKEDHRNYVELIGKSSWILKIKKQIKTKAQIKGRPTDRVTRKTLDSSGQIPNIIEYLMDHFDIRKDVDKQDLKSYINGIEA